MSLIHNIQRSLITLIVFLFPIFFLPITQEFFVTHKMYLVLYGSLVLLVLAAVQMIMERRLRTIPSPFTRIFIGLLLIKAISIFVSTPNKIQALYSLPTGLLLFAALILFYELVVLARASTKKEIPLFEALTLGGAVAAVISIVFYFHPFANFQFPPMLAFLQSQQFSLLGNLFDTIAFFAFLIVIIGADMLTRIKEKSSPTLQSIIAGGLIILALALVSFQGFMHKGPNVVAGIQLPPWDVSWLATVETLKSPSTALVGVGPDNFDTLFTLAKPASYNGSDIWQVNFGLAHSTVLHMWAEMGLLGLIALVLVVLITIKQLRLLMARHDESAGMLAVAGVFLTIVLLFFPPSFMIFFLSFLFLAELTQKNLAHAHEEHVIELFKKPAVYIAAAILMLLLVVGVGYSAGRVYASELYFKKAVDALHQNNGRAVYENMRKAIQLYPQNEKYRGQFSQINLLFAGNLAQKKEITDQDRQAISQFVGQSINEAKVLVTLSPQRAANWNNLAVIYRNITNLAQGADAWTVAAYQQAIRRDPSNPMLRLNLGGIYYGRKVYDSAALSFQQAVLLKPDWANAHYNLAWALFQQGKTAQAVAVMKNVLALVDKTKKDHEVAQKTLDTFNERLAKEKSATTSGQLNVPAPGKAKTVQEPLALPATPEAKLSPKLELPAGSGPEDQIGQEASPSATPGVSGTPTPTGTQ